jgi:hypothetical protein
MRPSVTGGIVDIYGPERSGSQGLSRDQTESGNRAILGLLQDAEVRDQVNLVITYRDNAYEVWSGQGMVRFRRVANGEGVRYEVIERHGDDPLAREDPTVLATLQEELQVSRSEDPDRCFFEPDQVSYPFAHERIASLFDSPLAPDLVLSPRTYTFGIQPGQHGSLDVVQSRAPLAFAGPGIRPARVPEVARQVDVAPTLCHLMGFPKIEGKDALGRTSETYLGRQDGSVLHSILDPSGDRPKRVYVIILDGLSHTELLYRLDHQTDSIPNLRRILSRAALFQFGSIVNFPSITWPSHSSLVTGAWCGHHDVVNPTYYLRDRREVVSPQGQTFESEGFLGDGVETLYEAFRRVRGSFTASIHEPQGRGADHAALERRVIGDRSRLKALTKGFMQEIAPRWLTDGKEAVHREAVVDARGLAQLAVLVDDPDHPAPELVVHELAMTDAAGHDYGPHSEGLREALDETDVRVGHIVEILKRKDLYRDTLFVVTADHGMASQDVTRAANPARYLHRSGMKAITAEPMIWLRDLAVTATRAADGRTARIEVVDNDPSPGGDHPPIGGAAVEVLDHPDRRIASGTTDAAGRFAFATPADVSSDRIALTIQHGEFNSRHVSLDGRSLAPDPRELYR